MANKKIILTVTTDPNYDQRMQRICTSLAENGYDVTLVGRILPYSVDLTNRNFKQIRLKFLFKRSVLFYAEYNIRIFLLLLFSNFDIVCSIDLDSILPGYIISKVKGKVFVHDAHELFTEIPHINEKPIVKKVWVSIEKFVFKRMKYAYTESEGYQAIYHQKYPNVQFKVIRNVPFYYETNRISESGDYILYQGALNKGRGLEQVIMAMKNIDYKLYIAGEGQISIQLRELVKKFNMEHKVFFLGFLKPSELRKYTLKAKIGLNLLDPKNEHYRHSFPNKLFDYIMAELPQISMNFPYYQSIVQDKKIGVLIDDFTPKLIEEAIKELLENHAFYKECVSDCKELKEVHNWTIEQKKLLSFYQKISI